MSVAAAAEVDSLSDLGADSDVSDAPAARELVRRVRVAVVEDAEDSAEAVDFDDADDFDLAP